MDGDAVFAQVGNTQQRGNNFLTKLVVYQHFPRGVVAKKLTQRIACRRLSRPVQVQHRNNSFQLRTAKTLFHYFQENPFHFRFSHLTRHSYFYSFLLYSALLYHSTIPLYSTTLLYPTIPYYTTSFKLVKEMNHKWTHELLERAKHSPDAVDPYARLDFWHTRPDESILLSTYDALTNTWSSSTHTARVEATPFAKGSMRTCYRMKKLSHFIVPATWENASAYVIKSYTNSNDVELNRDMVKMDIRVQMMAKLYAQWFNETQPPKKIDVMQVVMIEFPDRPGNPCFCGERYLYPIQ